MRKYLFSLAILSLLNLAAAPATTQHDATPWELLQQAGGLPATDSPRSSSMQYRSWPPYSKEWRDMAWDSEQQNGEQFRLLREARLLMQRNGGNAGARQMPMKPESLNAYFQSLSPMRNLANLISDGALFLYLNGNETEAAGRLLDCYNIASCVRQSHTLVSQLVGAGIEALDCGNICVIAPGLHSPNVTARQQYRKIIDGLLDDQPSCEAWRLSIIHEFHSYEQTVSEQGIGTEIAMGLSPANVDRDLLCINQACQFSSYDKTMMLLKQGTWPLMASIDHAFATQFRVLSERRMAATDLAVQLYRADHSGDWPKNLGELVPAYLPAVPRDPFSANEGSIGYEIIPHGWPNGKDRPVLFINAGPDFKLDSEPRSRWYNHGKEQVRQYRDLTLPK